MIEEIELVRAHDRNRRNPALVAAWPTPRKGVSCFDYLASPTERPQVRLRRVRLRPQSTNKLAWIVCLCNRMAICGYTQSAAQKESSRTV